MSLRISRLNSTEFSQSLLLTRTRRIAALLLAFLVCTVCAQEKNIYFGVSTTLANIDAAWNKTVDNSLANSLVPDVRRGEILIDEDKVSTGSLGVSALAGYRLPFAYNDYYLSIEFDIKADRSDIQGQMLGIGSSAGKNQLGESWPDQWELDDTSSRGATLKISTSPGFLSAIDMSVYALVGMRQLKTTFMSQFYGCLSSESCSEGTDTPNFTSGTDERDIQVNGATIGVGIGKELGQKIVLRLETRLTRYDDATWEDFFETVNVNVPSKIDTKHLGFSVGLTKYF